MFNSCKVSNAEIKMLLRQKNSQEKSETCRLKEKMTKICVFSFLQNKL